MTDSLMLEAGNRRYWRIFAVIAAMFALVAAGPWGWDIDALAGRHPCRGPCSLDEGDTFVGGPDDVWSIDIGGVGTAVVSGGAVVGRVEGDHALMLGSGHMEVVSAAAPRKLRVQTPAANVVDLGCAFTIDATATATTVRVSSGYVSVETPRGSAYVGAGSFVVATLGAPPALPLREDASAALVAAAAATPGGDLPAVLAAARPADAFTLWHLLRGAPRSERAAVLATLDRLAPGAVPADRSRLEDLHLAALQSLWEGLAAVAYAEAG